MPSWRAPVCGSIDPSSWTCGLECIKISFPLLPSSCLPHISGSQRPCSSSLAHLLPACLPAGCLQTHSSFLSGRSSSCRLTRVCEDLRHACGRLPACLCTLDHWCLYKVPACVCLHVWAHGSRAHFKRLLNHPSRRHACLSPDTSACASVHTSISSLILVRSVYRVYEGIDQRSCQRGEAASRRIAASSLLSNWDKLSVKSFLLFDFDFPALESHWQNI